VEVLQSEGVAPHTDPESCVVVRKVRGEALTGEHAGRVLSRERKDDFEGPTVSYVRKATRNRSQSQELFRPRVVGDPAHAWKLLTREPGDPTFGLEWHRGPRCESERSTTAMNEGGKSDSLIVAEKPSNKD
jgi:RNA-directed DNA polymerase